jgi:tetratricopeptide (TPR) repeat protein
LTDKITFTTNPNDLLFDLAHQSVAATLGHAQALTSPTVDQQREIVKFEMGLSTAQISDTKAGWLNAHGGDGGPARLSRQQFFVGINDSLGGNPSGAAFTPVVFTMFGRWLNLHPDSAESHFVLAMALGRVALQVGGKKKIELSKEIKSEAERTLALDSCHAGAMHILGRWHYELGNLSWVLKSFAKILYGGVPPSGGNEEARQWFEKAIGCDPRPPLHHLWRAKALLELKHDDLARENLEQCLRLAEVYWDDDQNKREAEKLLMKIKKT